MKLSTFQFQQLTKGYSFEIERLWATPPHYYFKELSDLKENLNLKSNEIGLLQIKKKSNNIFTSNKEINNLKYIIEKADTFKLHYYILKNHVLIFPNNFKFLRIPPKQIYNRSLKGLFK